MSPFDFDDEDETHGLSAERWQSLKPVAVQMWHANVAMQSELDAARARIAELEQQLKSRNKKLFGTSGSERRNKPKPAATPPVKQPGHGPREQASLPVEEVVHTLPEAEQVCDVCQGRLDVFEGQTEDSEEIDVLVRGYVRKQHRRQKYRCRCGGCIKTAPGPLKLVEGGRYSIPLAVEVACDKYGDHLPLERQARRMTREGLTLDSQTLWDMADRVAYLGYRTYRALQSYVLSQHVLGADETTWRLLGRSGKDAGPTERWYVWIAHAPDAAYYLFEDSRSNDAGDKLLDKYEGVLMCDGYGVYKSLAKRNPKVLLAHCWSHIRRAFIEVQENFQEPVDEVLGYIGTLYALESELSKTKDPSDEKRLEMRQTKSMAQLSKIEIWVWRYGQSTPPESGLSKAIKKMVNQWEGLARFTTDARIPLDNNGSERDARLAVQGRKNHHGSKSKRGTEVAAILYTLVESAKLSKLDPKAYLQVVVTRALRGESALLPNAVELDDLIAAGLDRDQATRALAQRTATA